MRLRILEAAHAEVGKPAKRYTNGSPEDIAAGHDCSSFVRFVLGSAGLHIPDHVAHDGSVQTTRHANELWDHYGIAVHEQFRMPGDLVFFSREGWWPTHVGIYVGDDMMIHSPGKNGEVIAEAELTTEPISSPDPAGGHRQLYDANPIGYKTPTVAYAPSYRINQTPLD